VFFVFERDTSLFSRLKEKERNGESAHVTIFKSFVGNMIDRLS
jgi:hypothetical protein